MICTDRQRLTPEAAKELCAWFPGTRAEHGGLFPPDVYGRVSEKMKEDSAAGMQAYFENMA